MRANFASIAFDLLRALKLRIDSCRLRARTRKKIARGANFWPSSLLVIFLSVGMSTVVVPPANADVWQTSISGGAPPVYGDACGMAIYAADVIYNNPPYYFGCTPGPPTGVTLAVFFATCWGSTPDQCSGSRDANSIWIGCGSGYVYVPNEGCSNPQPTAASVNCHCGDPIDLLTGYLDEHFVDYETAGPFPLKFERYYSNNGLPRFTVFDYTTLGAGGWRSNFDATLFNPYVTANPPLSYPHALYFALPDGRQLLFVDSTGNGNYVPGLISGGASVTGGKGVGDTVSFNATSLQITLTTTEGVNYVFSLVFNGSDRYLTAINFKGGYSQSLTYDPTTHILSSVTDNLGRSIGLQYDNVGHLVAVTAGGANVATYSYVPNAQANAVLAPLYPGGIIPPDVAVATGTLGSATRLPNNETSTYAYTDANNPYALTSYTDARGIVYSTWTYNAQFQAVSGTLAGPVGQTTVAYNTTGHTASATNALGEQQVVTYTISAANNVLPTQVQGQAIGTLPVSTTAYQYDSNDFVSEITDAEGRVTTHINDPTTGLPTSITRGYGSPSASTTTYTWNNQWRVPTEIVEPGRTSAYVWSASGQLTSSTTTDTTTTTVPYSTNGQTRTLTYAYGANNLVASVTGPLTGEVVSYTYNATGFVQTITDELGHVTTVTAWNSLGQPASITDPNGVISALTYDGDGRLTGISVDTAGTPATITVVYNAVGDITKITDPIGAWTSFLREQADCTLALVGDESGDVNEADDIRRIARFGDDHSAITVANQKGWALLQIQHAFGRRDVIGE